MSAPVTERRLWLVALSLLVLTPPPAPAETDTQLWLDADVGGSLTPKLSLLLKQSFRVKQDLEQFQTYLIDVRATHQTFRHLNLALGYRNRHERPKDEWNEENRPYADIVLKGKLKLISMSDRNRVEWRDRGIFEDAARYRNKLTLLWRKPIARQRPYIAGEWFWQQGSQDPEGADRIRATVGIRADPEDTIEHFELSMLGSLRYLKTDLYFTYEYNRSAELPEAYIFGLKLGLFF